MSRIYQISQNLFRDMTGDALRFIMHYNVFKDKYNFLQESQWWTKEQLEKYQLQELNKLLNHCYENVPYYRDLFDTLGLSPNDISSLKDLQKLPFLTKQKVKSNTEMLKSKNYPPFRFEYVTTGGSTGFPLGLYIENGATQARHRAFIKFFLENNDCHLSDKQVILFGEHTICKYQSFGRCMTLSHLYMTDEYLPLYIKNIRKLKPKYMIAYPSAITTLAKYMEKNNIEPFPSLKIAVCAGEILYDWQRDLIEKKLGCRIHTHYGHMEFAVFATSCKHSNNYHVFPQYGITELINRDGEIVTEEGETGEIVATGFNNYIFPFIRYKTGDLGVLTNQKCKCGRNYLLLKGIEGRLQDMIVSKRKHLISITGLSDMVATCSKNVRNCQIIQEKEGEIILNIVKDDSYTIKDEEVIKDNYNRARKCYDDINLTIQYVDKIMLTPRGKSKFLIQKLHVES